MHLTAEWLTVHCFSVYKLHPMQFMVLTLDGHELFMGTLFNNFSTDNNHDPIGISNGGQPVGNYKGGAPPHQIFQSLLHQLHQLLL